MKRSVLGVSQKDRNTLGKKILDIIISEQVEMKQG